MNDQDLELLESYLDDELTGRELDSLRQRLSVEPQLTAALDELRSQRETRQQFFAACEPDQASVQRLIRSVQREAVREVATGARSNNFRWIGGLAACLMFGFITGRGLHTNPAAVGPQDSESSRVAIAPTGPEATPVAENRVRFDGPRVPVNFGLNPGSVDFRINNPNMANVGSVDPFPGDRIMIYDQGGRLVQRFDSHQQYMKYVEEKMHATTQPTLAP